MVANQIYSKIPFNNVDMLFLILLTSFIFNDDDLSSTLNFGQARSPKSVINSLLSSKFSLKIILLTFIKSTGTLEKWFLKSKSRFRILDPPPEILIPDLKSVIDFPIFFN